MHSSYYLKAIQEFTANTQNTHDYHISSSVTMVLLQLSREYWGDVPDEKMSQGLFAEEKHSRNAELSIYEDFILKEHADYIGEIQKGKQEYFQKRGQAFARCKQELTVYAYQDEYKHYKDGILYVLGQAEEKISCYDFTFPYLVVKGLLTRKEAVQVQSAQKGYRTHIVAFPLIEVLSLLWLKINDPRSQLDKKAQILEMFQWFQSISMSAGLQICHHGLRNDLVLNVLNDRYYPDIHLIRIPIAAILHHTLLEGMKKQVIDFDRICKGESNQAKLKVFFTYLSAKKAMLEEFSGYLISQGCDPAFKIAGISLEDNSDACMVAMLEFSEALSAEELKVLNQLYAGVNWDTETEPTLLSVYQWLEENYSFEESEKHEYYLKALREFLEVSHAYHTIKHNASYVVMLGKGEEAKILWASCRSYFASLHSGFDPHTLKAQQSFVQQARQFNQEINKFRASHMEDDITQFFAKWVAASDSDDNYQLRNLYVFLCNPEVQQKILITDTYLEARLKQLKPGETELEISPYEANRIFLTAIIKEPLSWSPAFEKILMLALQSVKRDLNSPGLQTSWKQSSFPDALIRQLEYLLKCREDSTVSSNASASSSPSVSSSASSNHHAVIPRPMKMLVLPEDIETNYDWFRIHAFLKEEERIEIYAAHQEKIDGILIKYIDLLSFPAWRAGGWRNAFIVEDDMPDLVQWTLRYTLKSIPQQYLPKFLEKLDSVQLSVLSTTVDEIMSIFDVLLMFEHLPIEKNNIIFSKITQFNLEDFDRELFWYQLGSLSLEKMQAFLELSYIKTTFKSHLNKIYGGYYFEKKCIEAMIGAILIKKQFSNPEAWRILGSQINGRDDLLCILDVLRKLTLRHYSRIFVDANQVKIKRMVEEENGIVDVLKSALKEDELAVFIPELTKVDDGASSFTSFNIFASKDGQTQKNKSSEPASSHAQPSKSLGL